MTVRLLASGVFAMFLPLGLQPPVSVPKIIFYNSGEVRPGPSPMRCGLRAGWRDGSERLCQ